MLYLKNNKQYSIISASLFNSPAKFIKIIKKKNPNVFIGNISDYNNEKENIEYLNKLKNEKKI